MNLQQLIEEWQKKARQGIPSQVVDEWEMTDGISKLERTAAKAIFSAIDDVLADAMTAAAKETAKKVHPWFRGRSDPANAMASFFDIENRYRSSDTLDKFLGEDN